MSYVYLRIPLEGLHELIKKAVDAGVQDYISRITPGKDLVKKAEARRYIKACGFGPKMLQRWEDARLLTSVKLGEKRNCAVWYSLADIKKLICATRLKQLNNDETK